MEFQQVPEVQKRSRPWAVVRDIGRPKGIPEEECGTANSLIEEGTGVWAGALVFRTFFKPTEKELELLNKGGLVEFHQISNVMVAHGASVVASDENVSPVDDHGKCVDCGEQVTAPKLCSVLTDNGGCPNPRVDNLPFCVHHANPLEHDSDVENCRHPKCKKEIHEGWAKETLEAPTSFPEYEASPVPEQVADDSGRINQYPELPPGPPTPPRPPYRPVG